VAKRKTLFDDRPIEISELTYIIRQDIASLNQQIASLQAFVRSQKQGGAGKQVEEHNSNVVMMLQSRLANMGMGFKDVLELRTQNMKASKDRTEQFVHTAGSAAVPAPSKGECWLDVATAPRLNVTTGANAPRLAPLCADGARGRIRP